MPKITESQRKVSKELPILAEFLEQHLNQITGERFGFSLIIFNNVDDSYTSYVSNCIRSDVKKALEQLLKHWEDENEDIPLHERQ